MSASVSPIDGGGMKGINLLLAMVSVRTKSVPMADNKHESFDGLCGTCLSFDGSLTANPLLRIPLLLHNNAAVAVIPVRSWLQGASLNTKKALCHVHKAVYEQLSTILAMFDHYVEEPPPEVSADPSCSRNSTDEVDDWVMVKKQRVTIFIPPPSPGAAYPQADMLPKLSTKHCSLTRSSERIGNAARKKHPEQLTAKKCETIVDKAFPNMSVEISSHRHAAPVAKSELTKGVSKAVQGLWHQDTGKVTSSVGSMDESRMPVVSSRVASKIMRARLLERRVAGLGGLKNWLFDCGLGWFIDILDSEKLGMYQLVSLTMNQLKEMGLVAVGPRRKLIHAIDSLSCPHQFEMVS